MGESASVAGLNDAEEAAERERLCGNDQFKWGNYCAAIKYYNKSLSLDPDVAATYANRALCHLKMRDWNAAKSDCTEAIKVDCGYAKAFYRRALAFEGLGDLRGALKDLQVILDKLGVGNTHKTVAIKMLPDDAELLEKLKVIKRKLRVAFVKEVLKEEAENQKKLKKLEEASKSPQVLHLLHHQQRQGSRLEFKKGHPFEQSGEDHSAVPQRVKNFRFSKAASVSKATMLESPRPLVRT